MTQSTVSSSEWRGRRLFLGSATAGLLVYLMLTAVAWAQGRGVPEASVVQAGAATLRTVDVMRGSEAVHPALPVVTPPFLPTMDFGHYLEAKAALSALAGRGRSRGAAFVSPVSPAAAPVAGTLQCNGVTQLAPIQPPGTNFP